MPIGKDVSYYPGTVDVDEDADVHNSTLEQDVTIGAAWVDRATVEQGADIHDAAHIRNALIGEDTVVGVRSAVVNSYVGPGVTIGKDCKLTGCFIEEGARIGDGCELKDTLVGEDCSIGLGVKTEDAGRFKLKDHSLVLHGVASYPDSPPRGRRGSDERVRPTPDGPNARSIVIRPLYLRDHQGGGEKHRDHPGFRAGMSPDEWHEWSEEFLDGRRTADQPLITTSIGDWSVLRVGAKVVGCKRTADHSVFGYYSQMVGVNTSSDGEFSVELQRNAHVYRSSIDAREGPVTVGESAEVHGGDISGPALIGAHSQIGVVNRRQYIARELPGVTTLRGTHSFTGSGWEGVTLGERVRLEGGLSIGGGTSIGDAADIASGTRIGKRCQIAEEVDIEADVVIDDNVHIGARTKIATMVVIEPNVTIGSDVNIERDAVVETGVTIGEEAWIRAAALAQADVPPHGHVGGADPTQVPPERVIPVNANAEAWLYARLADVAGPGKLTREKVKAERPELLEHPLTKELLKAKPKPTGPELIALSEGAKDATKYLVKIVPRGWTGLQRIGGSDNDVMRFQLSEDLLDELVGFAPEGMQAQLEDDVLGYLKRYQVHSTADDLTLAWVRFFIAAPGSMAVIGPSEMGYLVVEEFQSDLPILRWSMGQALDQLDLATAPYHGSVSRRSVPTFWQDPYRDTQPFLAAAAAELGIQTPVPERGGTSPSQYKEGRLVPQSMSTMTLRPLMAKQEVLGDTGETAKRLSASWAREARVPGAPTGDDAIVVERAPWRYRPSVSPSGYRPPSRYRDANAQLNDQRAWSYFLLDAASEAADAWEMDPLVITPEDVQVVWESTAEQREHVASGGLGTSSFEREWLEYDLASGLPPQSTGGSGLTREREAWVVEEVLLMAANSEWVTLAAIDIHNKIMDRAAELFFEYQAARRQLWRNFVVQLHDLYETMLAFVLDWAAGRTQTVDGQPAGPPIPIGRVLIPTFQMKEKVKHAGRPPVYPYSKLYKRFQSASKVDVPPTIDVRNTEGGYSNKMRALVPNEPSIWSTR